MVRAQRSGLIRQVDPQWAEKSDNEKPIGVRFWERREPTPLPPQRGRGRGRGPVRKSLPVRCSPTKRPLPVSGRGLGG